MENSKEALDLVIEQNVPVPDRTMLSGYDWSQWDVGDSALVPQSKRQTPGHDQPSCGPRGRRVRRPIRAICFPKPTTAFGDRKGDRRKKTRPLPARRRVAA